MINKIILQEKKRTAPQRAASPAVPAFHTSPRPPALSSIQPLVSDFAQTVKQQADIVKVIEGYIRLRKSGAQNYSGLCPFHKEKSPSFSVHAVRQFYHCFGCQASGDVFSFVAKIENVTFPEAVRIVAQKCGIPLPKREFSSPEQAAESRAPRTKGTFPCEKGRGRSSSAHPTCGGGYTPRRS